MKKNRKIQMIFDTENLLLSPILALCNEAAKHPRELLIEEDG